MATLPAPRRRRGRGAPKRVLWFQRRARKPSKPVGNSGNTENQRADHRRLCERQIKHHDKEWNQDDAKQREQRRILNCIVTGNHLLSVKLPLCCYSGLNVSTTRRSFSAVSLRNTPGTFCNFFLRWRCALQTAHIFPSSIWRRLAQRSMVSSVLVF